MSSELALMLSAFCAGISVALATIVLLDLTGRLCG